MAAAAAPDILIYFPHWRNPVLNYLVLLLVTHKASKSLKTFFSSLSSNPIQTEWFFVNHHALIWNAMNFDDLTLACQHVRTKNIKVKSLSSELLVIITFNNAPYSLCIFIFTYLCPQTVSVFSSFWPRRGRIRRPTRISYLVMTLSAGGGKGCLDHGFHAPAAYTVQLLTLHQHRANNQYL